MEGKILAMPSIRRTWKEKCTVLEVVGIINLNFKHDLNKLNGHVLMASDYMHIDYSGRPTFILYGLSVTPVTKIKSLSIVHSKI